MPSLSQDHQLTVGRTFLQRPLASRLGRRGCLCAAFSERPCPCECSGVQPSRRSEAPRPHLAGIQRGSLPKMGRLRRSERRKAKSPGIPWGTCFEICLFFRGFFFLIIATMVAYSLIRCFVVSHIMSIS